MTEIMQEHPAPEQAPATGPSIFAEDLMVTGNMTSKGAVVVHGQIEGDLICDFASVELSAVISGGITAREVTIEGRVIGSVRAETVNLTATAHVEGDIYHHSLNLEHGAHFEGRSCRLESQTATAMIDASNTDVTALASGHRKSLNKRENVPAAA